MKRFRQVSQDVKDHSMTEGAVRASTGLDTSTSSHVLINQGLPPRPLRANPTLRRDNALAAEPASLNNAQGVIFPDISPRFSQLSAQTNHQVPKGNISVTMQDIARRPSDPIQTNLPQCIPADRLRRPLEAQEEEPQRERPKRPKTPAPKRQRVPSAPVQNSLPPPEHSVLLAFSLDDDAGDMVEPKSMNAL